MTTIHDTHCLRSQSQSVVRGEHPMAFMLPSVSLSEAGSESESMSCYSDVDTGQGMSPYTSLSSLTGSNIYSQSLSLLQPPHHGHRSLLQPPAPGHGHMPRSLPSLIRPHLRSASSLPRFSSLPKPGVECNDPEFQGHR